jgi:hypothetical protein
MRQTNGYFAAGVYRLEGIHQNVQKELLQLRGIPENRWRGALSDHRYPCSGALDFSTKQREGFAQQLVEINRLKTNTRRCCKASKACNELIDALNLLQDDLGEGITKLGILNTFGQQFCERPNGDQGILDLVGETASECSKGYEAFCPPLLRLGETNLDVQPDRDADLACDRTDKIEILGKVWITRALGTYDVEASKLPVHQHRQDALSAEPSKFAELRGRGAGFLTAEDRSDECPHSFLPKRLH